jgi:hypothetical protein
MRHQGILHRLQLLRIDAVAAEDGNLSALYRIAGFVWRFLRDRVPFLYSTRACARRRDGREPRQN